MGFLDRAKGWLGIGPSEPAGDDRTRGERPGDEPISDAGSAPDAREVRRPDASRATRGQAKKDGRPPLKEVDAPPSATVDDALALREQGDKEGARKVLAEIDRGAGLRTVLRAAAALEAGDESLLEELLPIVAREEPAWRLALQIAAALGEDPGPRASGAPAWALAWSRALSKDEATAREGLVELLFEDAALARTVAARDRNVPGAVTDPDAAPRYAAFAHGRDSIRRFGASLVAQVVERAAGGRRP